MIQIKVIILLFCVILSKNLLASPETFDKIIVNGDTSELFARPLKKYLSEKGNSIIGNFDLEKLKFTYEETVWYTHGNEYFATWKLENDSLFLIRVDPCRKVSIKQKKC